MWTARPTTQVIRSGFLTLWPEEKATAAAFSSMVDALVRECRQKSKSMTSGAKLPLAYVKIVHAIKKLGKVSEGGEGLGAKLHKGALALQGQRSASRHSLSLSPSQKEKVLQKIKTSSLAAPAPGPASSSRQDIFAMCGLIGKDALQSSTTATTANNDPIVLSSQELETGSEEAAETAPEEGEPQEEAATASPAPAPANAIVVDWAKMECKRFSLAGIEAADAPA